MGIFDSVRGGASKAKLHTEIALLDRQINQQQMAFGVEFYDRLSRSFASTNTSNNTSATFNALLPSVAIAEAIYSQWEDCRREVDVKQKDHDATALEAEKVSVNKERSAIKNPNQSSMSKAGNWMTDTGKEAKLRVRIKLLEREIQQRKGQFGVQVFDPIVLKLDNNGSTASSTSSASAGGLAAAVKKVGLIGKLAGSHAAEKDKISDCITNASRAIGLLRAQKDSKLREIAAIDSGVFR